MNTSKAYLSGKYICQGRNKYIQIGGNQDHTIKLKYEDEDWCLGKTRDHEYRGEGFYGDLGYCHLESKGSQQIQIK